MNDTNFLIKVSKLKEMPRTGWILRGIKNPETIADHIFRVAIASWVLATESGQKLNLEKIIKGSLSHDICEVYAGDVTPFFYYIRDLPKGKKEKEEFLKKYVRLLVKYKEKRGVEKFELEKRSLLKLIKRLPPETKKDIFFSWKNFENRSSKEGDFSRQVDKIETLIQAIEYFGNKKNSFANSWWEESEEFVDDPLLLNFLKIIQNKFYHKVEDYHKNEKLEGILDFILETGKLKSLPRLYWKLRGIKKTETVAGHSFSLAIAAWVLGKKQKELNMEKLLKMALCHELSAVYTNDTTPYDSILPKQKSAQKEILNSMLHISQSKKKAIFKKEYNEEKLAFEKLTKKLQQNLKAEIIQLWKEYRTRTSPEGNFLNQLNSIIVLLQGAIFKKEYPKLSLTPLWEWTYERCDNPICLQILEDIKKIS